ncbi:unnamed protein product [Rotaria sp. Silwood2]|nr:unnamed protein product [Rotaria sp. Silwood2]CAF4028322.1 unnamed protein product [Rotaria sp. Silwood2]
MTKNGQISACDPESITLYKELEDLSSTILHIKDPYDCKGIYNERRCIPTCTGHSQTVGDFDIRNSHVVQEYDRDLGVMDKVTFVDRNRRIVSTSDDRSICA